MMYKQPAAFCFIVSFFCSTYCFGQAAPTDSTVQTVAMAHAVNFFNAGMGQQSRLYNGPEYYPYDAFIKGNAYFQDINEFKPGAVIYDGISYTNVPMMYDINKDVVAVLLYNNFSRFSLLNERVESFDLFDHHFVRIIADSLINTAISTGFYDELYNGNTQALAKWTKTIQSVSTAATIDTYFTRVSKDYYLKKGSAYYKFGSQGSLLNVLKDKKKELQQYIKAGKIRYKDDPDKAIALIAARYDQLLGL